MPYIRDEASGPSYSVPALCASLAVTGADIELHVLQGGIKSAAGYRCFTHGEWSRLRRLHVSPALERALASAAPRADILHHHGLWTMANVYPGRVAAKSPCRLVTSPRGTLSAWALGRGRWRKKMMWWLCQARALHRSACFHATAHAEYEDIRRAGLRGPVAIIPNGIDIPPPRPPGERPPGEPGAGRVRPRRLLFLGRLHPVKGVDVLLAAWREIQGRFPDWELHIVGPGEGGYLERMRRLGGELGVARVYFPGPVYAEAKSEAYRQADLFVLPSRTENFAVAVAEALAHGLPAVVSRNAPWSGLASERCGWWIEQGQGELAECLRHALALPAEDLRQRGARGRAWMERDFSWRRIGERMHHTYQWLISGGRPPSWVMEG